MQVANAVLLTYRYNWHSLRKGSKRRLLDLVAVLTPSRMKASRVWGAREQPSQTKARGPCFDDNDFEHRAL